MGIEELLSDYRGMLKEIRTYEDAVNLLYWDMRTKAPKAGANYRSDLIAALSTKAHEVLVSQKMSGVLSGLLEIHSSLDEVTLKSVMKTKKEHDRFVLIPLVEFEEYVKLQSQSEAAWESAKDNNDFEAFKPFLEKLVETKRRFVSYWRTNEAHPYDVLLDQYEPGMKVEILDPLFKSLGGKLSDLSEKIIKQQEVTPVENIHFELNEAEQEELCLALLNRLKYDFTKGRLDKTEHPFQITIHANDVRITTKYRENDLLFSVFGVVHEFGHALYEMQLGKEFIGSDLYQGASMGIHESQSLLFENILGRSKEFWKANFDLIQSYTGVDGLTLDSFYKQINQVKKGKVRLDADEVTYPLHIVVRYEIEKALISGELEVSDVQQAWNERMKEYLGVMPENDSEGVLQDVHWSGGDFGYFPSYALGFVYAAQFFNTMKHKLPLGELIEKNDWEPIQAWLEEQIHSLAASKKPIEILELVTGEAPNEKYLLEYLTNKYLN